MINKNKLIAEFMYWDIDDPRTFPKTCQQPVYDGCWGDYRFDTSWDWLMPVIEKIETLGYTFEKNYQPIDKDWQSLIVKGNDILYQEFDNESIKASYYVVCELIAQLWEKKIGFKRGQKGNKI
jgi:hypothetical protein